MKYKRGYTTGVFDMFHIGHLNLLLEAKKHCEYLVVGVTTDDLSFSRKNKLPIINQDERKNIVSALKCVDEVVFQTNMDKFSAWEQIQFDVMIVGDDWKGTPQWIEYEKQFKAVGVDIIYLPYTSGISSTIIRQKLKK